eukprot:14699365-Ditylum_brightwellii.AAC.1
MRRGGEEGIPQLGLIWLVGLDVDLLDEEQMLTLCSHIVTPDQSVPQKSARPLGPNMPPIA